MLTLPPSVRIYLAVDKVDMRCGHDASADGDALDGDAPDGGGSDGGTFEVDPNHMFHTCLDGWPAPSTATPSGSLTTTPRILWSVSVPEGRGLIATSSGALFVAATALTTVSSDGKVATTLQSSAAAVLSHPIADDAGNVYLADSGFVYSIDQAGQERWRAPLGANQALGEFPTPSSPVVSDSGLLYVAGLDGNLTTLRSDTGAVVPPSSPIGVLCARARGIALGVGSHLLVERENNQLGIMAVASGAWADGLALASVPEWQPGIALGGGKVGLVVAGLSSLTEFRTQIAIADHCGKLLWKVPGPLAFPVSLTFGDDLIVVDQDPSGGSKFDLRRFSSDGTVVAGPVPVGRAGLGVVGADDVVYFVSCASSSAEVLAFDSSLRSKWMLDLGVGGCPEEGVLGPGGILYYLRPDGAGGAALTAVATTSPDPAPAPYGASLGNRWLGDRQQHP